MENFNQKRKQEFTQQSVELSLRVAKLDTLLQITDEIAQTLNIDLDKFKETALSFHNSSLPDLQNVWELAEIDFDEINSIRLAVRGISDSINVLSGLAPPPKNTNPN